MTTAHLWRQFSKRRADCRRHERANNRLQPTAAGVIMSRRS